MRALSIVAVCLLVGCQFRVDGDSGGTQLGPDASILSDLAVPDDLTPPPDLAPPLDLTSPSVLVVTSAPLGGSVDLTQVGTVDWAHYGFSSAASFDDKATGGQRISMLTALPNSGTPTQFGSTSVQFSWSDGAMGTGRQPTASNSTTDVYVTSGGQSLQVPAGVTPQRLIVYVALQSASAQLQVSLSDGSEPMFTSTQTPVDTADHAFAYTIDFAAAAPGQTLTVSWSLVMATAAANFGAGVGGAALTTVPTTK